MLTNAAAASEARCYSVVGPPRGRRLALGAASLAGCALLALTGAVPDPERAGIPLLVTCLAAAAGLSTLWSP